GRPRRRVGAAGRVLAALRRAAPRRRLTVSAAANAPPDVERGGASRPGGYERGPAHRGLASASGARARRAEVLLARLRDHVAIRAAALVLRAALDELLALERLERLHLALL